MFLTIAPYLSLDVWSRNILQLLMPQPRIQYCPKHGLWVRDNHCPRHRCAKQPSQWRSESLVLYSHTGSRCSINSTLLTSDKLPVSLRSTIPVSGPASQNGRNTYSIFFFSFEVYHSINPHIGPFIISLPAFSFMRNHQLPYLFPLPLLCIHCPQGILSTALLFLILASAYAI